MSITDELRTSGVYEYAADNRHFTEKELTAIADRIDAEHERECKEQYACGVEHGIGASIDASMIQTRGYVELPKDADGEYIHVGDVMEVINGGLQAEACYMQIGPSGNWSVGLTKQCRWYDTESLRHRHEPTVEDVLREFALAVCKDDAMTIRKGVVEEYAAKLRLAEGEDA